MVRDWLSRRRDDYQYVLQIITNIVDYDMNLQQAVDAPRIHNQWLPDEVAYEPYALSEDTLRILRSRVIHFASGLMQDGPTAMAIWVMPPE